MAKTLEYKIIDGNLNAVSELTKAGYHLQTAQELQKDYSQQNISLHGIFYVADGSFFYQDPKNGALFWAHTDGEHNLVIQPQYLKRALKDMFWKGMFRPDTAKESWTAINHQSTKKFALDNLGLVVEDNEWSTMRIKTNNYNALTPVQKMAANMVGFTPKIVAYLQCIIKEARLWLPSPEYLSRTFKEGGKDPIWRASSLECVHLGFRFCAYDRAYEDNYLRGIRKVNKN